ncbi:MULTISPECIES: sulfur carrier protein ThiS [Ectothiorhodospira]|uniref:Sulfur carrier protein n=1 Tax=Ectothiorhodospira magna TaxID=867345 RepID=A0A1H9GPN9_9GAMM|nr:MULTISPECIES: sulfur carrier protein ThiS [Ectothiorhodospira]MCG5514470.1 sulfur carrier protein ThiS [Ectothiorhodospira shaposhnikovii]SEQ52013.1 sulfur carrier protein [Ectothiorhodospira magna]
MDIIVNGETRQLPEPPTATALVEALGLTGRRLAMEVNGELLPRSRFDAHRLAPGDRIEIVQAIGGG